MRKPLKAYVFAILMFVTGCTTHYHTLTVTSNPSGQRVEVEAVDESEKYVGPLNNDYQTMSTTPCEFTFKGEVARATVFLNPVRTLSTNKYGETKTDLKYEQAKSVSFHHGLVEVKQVRDGVI